MKCKDYNDYSVLCLSCDYPSKLSCCKDLAKEKCEKCLCMDCEEECKKCDDNCNMPTTKCEQNDYGWINPHEE